MTAEQTPAAVTARDEIVRLLGEDGQRSSGLFCDGAVQAIRYGISPMGWHNLCALDDGNSVDLSAI